MANPCFDCIERIHCCEPCEVLISWVREGCPDTPGQKREKKKK